VEPLSRIIPLIDFVWRVMVLIFLLRIVLSWRRVRLHDRLGRLVALITEPILIFCRLLVDTRSYGFDISPLLALVLLWLLRNLLIWLL
jgi:uncharacterized protein YggT (Ycf19 family)